MIKVSVNTTNPDVASSIGHQWKRKQMPSILDSSLPGAPFNSVSLYIPVDKDELIVSYMLS